MTEEQKQMKECIDIINGIPEGDLLEYTAHHVTMLKPVNGWLGGAVFKVDAWKHRGYVIIARTPNNRYEVHFGKIVNGDRVRQNELSRTNIRTLPEVAASLRWMSDGAHEFAEEKGFVPHGQHDNPMTLMKKIQGILNKTDIL
jgi:hypothetical protein